MNNQDFAFPEVDSDFHINVRNGNNVPAAFQGEDEIGMDYVPNAFHMHDVNYYQDIAKGQNGSSLVQAAQSIQISSEPGLGCSVFSVGINAGSAGYANSSGQTQDSSSQQYCSQYSSQNVANTSALPFSNCLEPPQETQFLNNATQAQECLNQFQHQDLQSQTDVFASRVPPVNDKVGSNIQEPDVGTFATSSTEFIECNSDSQILYPSVSAQPIVTTSTPYSGSNEATTIPGSYDGISSQSMNEYPQPGTSSLSSCKSDSVSAITSNPQQIISQGHKDGGTVSNTGEFNQYSDNSTVNDGTLLFHQSCDETSGSNIRSITESSHTPPEEVSESYLGLAKELLNSSQDDGFSLQPVSEDFRIPQQDIVNCGQSKDSNEQPLLSHSSTSKSDEVSVNCGQSKDSNEQPLLSDSSTSKSDEVSVNCGQSKDSNEQPLLSDSSTSKSDEVSIESFSTSSASEMQDKVGLLTSEKTKHIDQFVVESMSEMTTLEDEGQTKEGKSNVPQEENCGTKEPSACYETLDDLTNRLEEGIASTSDNITMEDRQVNCQEVSSAKGEPLSPMITVMDSTLGEGEETEESQNAANSGEAVEATKQPEENENDNVRVTRTLTGSLRNKTQRFIEECGDSDDSFQGTFNAEDWEYEEGAELAPSKVDSSITASDNVLTVTPEELDYYNIKFPNGVNAVLRMRLHCTTCGRHIGAAPNYIHLGNRHKVLRVLTCNRCRSFYGVGKFPKDSDGSELYCRWCGQGGQVICCSTCPNVFCEPCIKRNFGPARLNIICNLDDWACFLCNYKDLWELRSICWAVLTYTMQKKKDAISTNDVKKMMELEEDTSKCCNTKNHKKRKPTQAKSKASSSNTNISQKTPAPQEEPPFNSFEFGHFLFQNDNFPEAAEMEGNCAGAAAMADPNTADEDDFIDPSQFVQPVLEEQQSPKSIGRLVQRPPPKPSQTIRAVPPPAPRPQSILRPRVPQQAVFNATAPRIIIRQGNLMQPGLVPINNQPNCISSPIARAPVSHMASSGSVVRNPAHYLNNIEGVRSLDQLQSLNQVPWFRDGIDSIRSTGFALSKRIRELEARFHSLKNKQDIEKVMILGKKLQRLQEKTMLRYKQMNLNLNEACKRWYIKKLGVNSQKTQKLDPLSLYSDSADSDWDDDTELSKPLEKVMIPVSSSALSSVGRPIVRPIVSVNNPPPLIRTSAPISVLRPQVTMRTIGQTPSPVVSSRAVPPLRTGIPSANPLTFIRQQLPGPKSGAIRYRQVLSTPLNAPILKRGNPVGVGAFLNDRNGFNSVSVTLTPPPKRKRVQSSSSDCSDVVVCPTIPDLLKMYNIKPCKVELNRNDGFIVSFLENQETIRRLKSCTVDMQETNDCEISDAVNNIPEMETVMVSCEVAPEASGSIVESIVQNIDVLEGHSDEKEESVVQNASAAGVFQTPSEDDDDIEIIDEVNPLELDTRLSDSK